MRTPNVGAILLRPRILEMRREPVTGRLICLWIVPRILISVDRIVVHVRSTAATPSALIRKGAGHTAWWLSEPYKGESWGDDVGDDLGDEVGSEGSFVGGLAGMYLSLSDFSLTDI